MNLIVAVDENWGIGKDGDLLHPISADLKYFRTTTTGGVIVMGRKTLESFPKKKPLPKRVNIVLTGNKDYPAEGIVLCHDPADLPALLADYADQEVFVIGGGSIYEQLLPLCDKAYVTHIRAAYPADTFFPDLDKDPAWEMTTQGELQEEDGVQFSFDIYTRK